MHMNISRWSNRVFAVGIGFFALYMVVDRLRLPAGLRTRLKPLSGLAQEIGGVCYNDGDGEWINSIIMSKGEEAVTAALSELVGIRETKVSSCAISHVRSLRLKGAIPALEKIAADVDNPNHEFAKSVLEGL
jgi:hypothetical protein